MAAMSLFRHVSRPQPYLCRQCTRKQLVSPHRQRAKSTAWAGRDPDHRTRAVAWEEQARAIRSGAKQSMLSVLEERGFVKDVAGGRQPLDWLLTEKPIGAYVGVDPTAPSLHVGHLLPLMALYWMYLHGFSTVTLLGGGTVEIGDPSGRASARSRQRADTRAMNTQSIEQQLAKLWTNVKCLGIKHKFSADINRKHFLLNNRSWLSTLNAVELMRDLGSGMRLGTMLSRDSVKLRMENGSGMSISEFCYPLFQAYDWWSMYSNQAVQLQIGGSDQYGNICAGMDAVHHMRQLNADHEVSDKDTLTGTFGLTTPLLTTASGEKFGKSAGNAVWLDKEMLSSFDLYQYFLRTSDDDVERYLKLFTFLPVEHIHIVMAAQHKDASRRTAQHLLAKEMVELAHGASEAWEAAEAHKEAFSQGTNTFPITTLRKAIAEVSGKDGSKSPSTSEDQDRFDQTQAQKLLAYKREFAGSSPTQATTVATNHTNRNDTVNNVVTLPNSLLRTGCFPQVLRAAGLVSSNSEGHRLIAKKGAYVVLPNSGSPDSPRQLKWQQIPDSVKDVDPNHYLVDWEALVLRSGKSKIQICRIIEEERFDAEGLTCPGWEEFKARRIEATATGHR